jgi:hypothetical protein
MQQKLFLISLNPKNKNDTWIKGDVVFGKNKYNLLFKMSEKPDIKGINGNRIIDLEILQGECPLYVYHKGWKRFSRNIESLQIYNNVKFYLEKHE